MKTTFNEFKEAMSWYWDEGESIELVWENEKDETQWKAKITTNNNLITKTLLKYLVEYNIGIQIVNNKIYLYH